MSELSGETALEDLLVEVARQVLAGGSAGRFDPSAWAAGPWACRTVCVEICPESVQRVLDAGAERVGVPAGSHAAVQGLAGAIDHTLLKPEASLREIDQLCAEALEHRFATVCVNGVHVRRCAEILSGSGVGVCAVVGFPLGASAPEVKAYEARRALEDGAREIDMVQNVGALKSGDDEFVRRDVAAVAETVHRAGGRLKVILETCLLSDEEITRAARLAKAGGADFVKTSTGFSKGGATAEDVARMRAAVGPSLGVKASGGVRTTEDARRMLAAGATRLGASASVAIVRGG